MKRLISVLLLFTLSASAQVSKKYPSLLWKISGNGLSRPSYLYGTMHVSHRAAWHLSEEFFKAFENAQVVGLETDPGTWLQNMELTGELSELNRVGDAGNVRDFYGQSFAPYFPERRMLQGIISYDPDIINGLLYRRQQQRENFEESTYLDLFIYQSAKKLKKPVISLEDFTEAEIRSRLASVPDKTDDDQPAMRSLPQTDKIEDAYRSGDLDLLDSLSRLSASKNLVRFLIDERNEAFVATMDSVMKRSTMFSGVGAAHLPGPNGMIELLRKKGYEVEPVMPVHSKKARKRAESLDGKTVRVATAVHFAPDSAFSVKLPGKAYPIVDIGHLKYFIHPDMVNGSFYTIVRLRYPGPLFNVTPLQMQQRVDSLLFEAVPGKIMSKKPIVVNGVTGLDITNRTRRGDAQRYRIFFTASEMMIFKLGGKGDYALSKAGNEFFSSIRFTGNTGGMFTFTPPAGGFAVKIPKSHDYVKYAGAVATGPVEDLIAWDGKGNCYGVRRAVYNDFDYLEEDTFELNQISVHILEALDAKENVSRMFATQQGFPCLQFSGTNTGGTFHGKLFLRGVHYYLAYQYGNQSTGFESDFFQSFELIPFRSIYPLKEITDKDMWFKAVDEVTDDALSRFQERYRDTYNRTLAVNDSLPKTDHLSLSLQKRYYSPSSNEFVNIRYNRFDEYDFRDPTTFKQRIATNLTRDNSMRARLISSSLASTRHDYHFRLTDTATARGIEVKVIVNHGAMLQLEVPCDTMRGPEGWAKGFFESFTPVDTVIGQNIFAGRFPELLSDLASADTVKRRKANSSLRNGLPIHKSHTRAFVQFLSGPFFNRVNEDSRGQLIVNGGELRSDEVVAPYSKLYRQYSDSFYLQLCILKGLAGTRTKAAVTAFGKLITADPPLVGDAVATNDVFSQLHDSLPVARHLFPGLLALTRHEEYREPVYALLAALVNAGLIEERAYAAHRKNILADANLALKRYNPSMKPSDGQFDHLERTARELAENIKENLDGLATNNFYKGSRNLKNIDASARHPLVNYAFILSPAYKSEPAVRDFFTRISKLRSQAIAMPVTINLLKQNVVINDTLIPYYSKNKFTRVYFYSELEKEQLSDRFDKRYLSQQSLIESVLTSQSQLFAYYNQQSDRKTGKDSLVLVKQMAARNKYQEGTLYIYRNARSAENRWSVVFVEGDREAVNPRIEVIAQSWQINRGKTEQENIDDLLSGFYLSYRKRSMQNQLNYE